MTCLLTGILLKRPETEEYGISSFVYRGRRPFHPQRLWDFINTELSVASDSSDDDDGIAADNNTPASTTPPLSTPFRRATSAPAPPCILRSKGFFWLATRPMETLVWSQAGGLFQMSPGGAWWADTPQTLWPTEDGAREDIMGADWDSVTGDRRYVHCTTCATGLRRI